MCKAKFPKFTEAELLLGQCMRWPRSWLVCFCWPGESSNEFRQDKWRAFDICTSRAFCYPFSPLSIPGGWEQQAGPHQERGEGSVWSLLLHLSNYCGFWCAAHTFAWYRYSQGDFAAIYSVKPRESYEDHGQDHGGKNVAVNQGWLYCLWKTLQKPVCRPLGQFTWEKRKHCCCTDSDWLPKLMAGKWWVHHPLVYLRTHRTSCKRI